MLAAASANAYDAYIDGIYYNLNSDTKQAEVTSGDSEYNGSVVIPETVTYDGKTYNVTSIGKWAFYNQGLPSVTIGNNVTSIGTEAFVYCYNLESITIPKRVTSIGAGAFMGCSSLTSIKVETGNTTYDSRNDCNALIETASNTLIVGCMNTIIPNSVTNIGERAFYECYPITSITFPESLTSIGSSAFYGCYDLTSITIPKGVTNIGDLAFSGCNGLISINVEEGNAYYDSRNNCNALIETASNTLIIGCINTVIPNGVTTIGNNAFAGCGLTSIAIPGSVISIGGNAFFDCKDLTSVSISEGVTSIGERAFSGCSALTSITIPESATNLGDAVFIGCRSLTSVTIPEGVTNIGHRFFFACTSLTSVTIPESVTKIGSNAFQACYNLSSITIPKNVTTIEDWAFQDCNSLTSITIPEGIKYISYGTFSGCSSLTSIVIPNSVTVIGRETFMNCSGLTSVTLGNGVQYIGEYAFCSCASLTTIESYINEPFVFGVDAFSYLNAGAMLIVPQGTRDAYLAMGWTEDVFPGGVVERAGSIEVAIGAAGYATLFSAESNLEIPEGVKAYTGTINGEWLTLNEVEGKIPAGTAVVLKGEPGTYELQTTTDAAAVSENDLKGTAMPLVADGTQYILYEKGGVTAFYQATPGSTIPAGKAYIETDGAGVKGFFFADDATAIEETLSNSPLKGENIYNLAGQRLNRMQDGINIVNGKKVLVK